MQVMDEFKKYVLNLVQDGYLDRQEERAAMMKAADLGLDNQSATHMLEDLCEENGAVLERQALQDFQAEIKDLSQDGFLDDDEYEGLLQQGMLKFAGADAPVEIVEAQIKETLSLMGAYTQKQLREDVGTRLQPVIGQGGRINSEQWANVCSGLVKNMERLSVDLDENDIPRLLEKLREDHGVYVSDEKPDSNKMLVIGVGILLVLVGIFLVIASKT
jgi:hypothetical protein